MDELPKSGRWWQKKRWIAAGLFALAAWYPLSAGPAFYIIGRGWLSQPARRWLDDAYDPIRTVLLTAPLDRTPAFKWWGALVETCFRAGRDAADAEAARPS
jgi:hypothetical protein